MKRGCRCVLLPCVHDRARVRHPGAPRPVVLDRTRLPARSRYRDAPDRGSRAVREVGPVREIGGP